MDTREERKEGIFKRMSAVFRGISWVPACLVHRPRYSPRSIVFGSRGQRRLFRIRHRNQLTMKALEKGTVIRPRWIQWNRRYRNFWDLLRKLVGIHGVICLTVKQSKDRRLVFHVVHVAWRNINHLNVVSAGFYILPFSLCVHHYLETTVLILKTKA